MMKKIFLMILFAMTGMAGMAQSCDFEYPIGTWVNCIPGEEENSGKAFSLWMEIERETKPIEEMNNHKGCGYLTVTDNKTEKDVFYGALSYVGKGLSNGVGNGVYYFEVTTKDGKTGQVGIRKKNNGGNIVFVNPTGVMAKLSYLNDVVFNFTNCTGRYCDPTLDATTLKDFYEGIRDAEPDASIPGFANRKLYVNSHIRLTPGKPYYAKPKGASAINIRDQRNATAAKMGELSPGNTLLVVDEYDGWCQVKLGDKQYGWVSLSVVTLTNTKGTSAAPAAPAANAAFPQQDH
jgi:SH3-like domain-containing protein